MEADAGGTNFLIHILIHKYTLLEKHQVKSVAIMKLSCSIAPLLLLLPYGGNAFSAQKKPSSVSSRKDFLKFTSAAAVAAVVANPQQSVAMDVGGKIQFGPEEIMAPKEHGTSAKPVQSDLLYGVDNKLSDKICNFNRYVVVEGRSRFIK
jgi:hypothetical protein